MDGRFLFLICMDAREVRMCSTVKTVYSGKTVTRRGKNINDYAMLAVLIPMAVRNYNCFLGLLISLTLKKWFFLCTIFFLLCSLKQLHIEQAAVSHQRQAVHDRSCVIGGDVCGAVWIVTVHHLRTTTRGTVPSHICSYCCSVSHTQTLLRWATRVY